MEFEETISELSRSLIGSIIPIDEISVRDRWREWMKLHPGETLEEGWTGLVRRKKYHFRMAYESLMMNDAVDEDSPLKPILSQTTRLALIKLRKTELDLMRWDMEFGNVVLSEKTSYDIVRLHATSVYKLEEWVHDRTWELNRQEGRKLKRKLMSRDMPSRIKVLGECPNITWGFTNLLKRIYRGYKFLSEWSTNGIEELLMNNEDKIAPQVLHDQWIKRAGFVVGQHDLLFRIKEKGCEDKKNEANEKKQCQQHQCAHVESNPNTIMRNQAASSCAADAEGFLEQEQSKPQPHTSVDLRRRSF